MKLKYVGLLNIHDFDNVNRSLRANVKHELMIVCLQSMICGNIWMVSDQSYKLVSKK